MRILVVAPSWIGDTIMAQPLFQRLAQQHSNLEIDALAPPWVAPLLERMPEVSRVIDSPFRHGGMDWPTRRRIGEQLRSEGLLVAFTQEKRGNKDRAECQRECAWPALSAMLIA